VPRILRPGAIGAAEIEEVVEVPVLTGPGDDEDTPRVSGTLPGHYAPRTPLILVPAQRLAQEVATRVSQGLRVAVLGQEISRGPRASTICSGARAHRPKLRHDLYAHLRALDRPGDLILVERPRRRSRGRR
jgi:L-threonylcarbamoyladenylate synthase